MTRSHDWRNDGHGVACNYGCGAIYVDGAEPAECPFAPDVMPSLAPKPPMPRKPPKREETALMLAIWDALLATGRVLLWRNNVGAARVRDYHVAFGFGLGSPDLVGILRGPGTLFAVEVKVPGESPEPAQLAWHRAARAAGAIVIVAHSVDEALAGLPA